MKYRALRRHLTTALVALVIGTSAALAQAPAVHPTTALQVRGLTSAMRDGLAQDLQRDGHFRIAFACVPAGILILEPTRSDRQVDPQISVLPLLHQRIDRNSISPSSLDRNTAEAQCAEARNR